MLVTGVKSSCGQKKSATDDDGDRDPLISPTLRRGPNAEVAAAEPETIRQLHLGPAQGSPKAWAAWLVTSS
jgi:hypothetical protein